jgi:hypothetical protein
MRAIRVLAAAALLAGVAGCGGSTAAATTPTATRTTDTFTGTVTIGGSDFHSFPVASSGEVDVTLTAVTPPSAIVMGLSLGVPANTGCTALAGASTSAPAGSVPQLSGMVSTGTLCVQVRDVSGQTAPVSYTVTVVHP